MRNYLMGLVWGTALAGLGLGTASYMLPARIDVPAPAPEAEPTAAEPTAAPATSDPAPAPSAAPATSPVTAPAAPAPAAPAPAAPAQDPVAPAASAQPAAETTDPAAAKPATDALLDPAPAAPATGAKVATPPAAGQAVQTPTIAEPAAAQPSPAPAAAQSAAPLQAFAAPFAGAGGKPIFAIVVLDTGAEDIDRAVWASLPLPITFAVDPESATAAAALALYRAAGKEVVIVPKSLPKGAAAADVEQSMAAYAQMLPETVAVMSAPEGGFQDDRDMASLVVPAIGAQGRGVLLIDKGLNSAAQIAQREGIPFATIGRAIDAQGETVSTMRRVLDRAVFSAAQDGAAVVLGQTLPDTMTALTEWSVEGRASDVTLAPISALMQAAQ